MNLPYRLSLVMASCLAVVGCRHVATEAKPEHSVSTPGELPGARGDGSVLLPNQWLLRPAGRQVAVGDFPVNIALHPSGKYAAVLHCGYGVHEVAVLQLASGKVIGRVPVDIAFYGITFTRDGQNLLVSGAASEVVHRYAFNEGYLSQPETLALRDASKRGVPAGLAVNADGTTLYAANVWGSTLSAVDLKTKKVAWEHTFASETGGKSYATNAVAEPLDVAAITKRAEVASDVTETNAPFPYGCVLDETRGRLYVSLWALASVSVLDLKSHAEVARWKTGGHPNEMLLDKSGKHLYVANGNNNSVTVINVESGKTIETLEAVMAVDNPAVTKEAAETNSPPGMTPNSVAISPDGKTLFVANATINALAVFDVSEPGRSRSLGFIPTGWYPTSVRVTPDGKQLIVANGKGLTSRSNRHGPQPGREVPASVREYIAGLLTGSISVVTLPKGDAFTEQMQAWTKTAVGNRPQGTRKVVREPGHPIPVWHENASSPIKHCIYIIKENRTYDQVLGDMKEGNGDAAICLFGEKVTPNHHALAREFVLLDNFYVDGEVSADGHEWTMGAYATDFVEKNWPLSYGHNASKKFPYPSERNFPIATPAGGYLWDRAREVGVSYRSYGEFVSNSKSTNQPNTCRVSALKGNFDPWYRSFDMDYPDQLRADRFLSELRRFEKEGQMPSLQIVRLPNDHTAGTAAGKLTPVAQVADNDLALGRVVEGVSKSKFWSSTAIFVIEDDAQNGSDHVDAHRSIAFVISPYVKRRSVDSTMYSTSSMLRTMELILGLKPMSQYDAAAMPMFNSFTAKQDLTPYQARPAQVDLNARNLKTAWGADLSAKMNFAREDAADDLMLNRVIWHSIKGADVPMPAPKRAAFLLQTARADADGD